MFRQPIAETPLVNDVANNYFKIYGSSYLGDITFLSTLRALIAPRMKNHDDMLNLYFYAGFTSSPNLSPSNIIKESCYLFDSTQCNSLHIHNVIDSNEELREEFLNLLKSNFCKIYKGWHRLEKVTDLFRNQFKVLCFINPDIKSTIVFVEDMTVSKMHYLQVSIFGLLPWYFDPKDGVSQDEMDLINTLREKKPNAYLDMIKKFAEKYDFRTEKIKSLLAGFETRYEVNECERVKNVILNTNERISRYNSELGSLLNEKNDLEIRLLGLEAKIASNKSEDSEIMDYFIRNKRLDLVSVDNSFVYFVVKDYIMYFDEDMAKDYIENENSYFYNNYGNPYERYIPAEQAKKLLNAIFIDQIIKIKTCAAYRFSLNGNVEGRAHYPFSMEYSNYLPNPHIQEHACMGNYVRAINELLQKNDYITALEQTVASARNLNFSDSIVMKQFVEKLYGLKRNETGERWLELPDGSMVSPKEAIEWLLKQEESGNE